MAKEGDRRLANRTGWKPMPPPEGEEAVAACSLG